MAGVTVRGVLRVLSVGDVLSPAWAALADWWHGDALRCGVPAADAVECRLILQDRRIASWGWCYNAERDSVSFSVHKRQAGLVAHLLGLVPVKRGRR